MYTATPTAEDRVAQGAFGGVVLAFLLTESVEPGFSMKLALKILLPLLVIVAGGLVARKMIRSRPPVEIHEPEVMIPAIRTIEVQPESVRLSVKAYGTVVPRTESVLAPEIAGRIIYVSPSLRSGGFFEDGERLVQLDSIDYELAAVQARSAVAQAQLRLEQEQAEAAIALREWQSLGEGEASSLLKREPQLAQAQAALESAGLLPSRPRGIWPALRSWLPSPGESASSTSILDSSSPRELLWPPSIQ